VKVGVVLGNIPPEHGGEYNFKIEIVSSIFKLRTASRHTFVLFSFDKEPPEEIAKEQDIQFVSLHRSFIERLRAKFFQIVHNLFMKLRYPTNPPEVKSAFEKFCLSAFLKNDIEFIIYLEQNFFVTFDIPYMTIVWDLQHRLQPYFPEVSSNGIWDKRESAFKVCLQRATAVIVGTQVGKSEVECFYQIPSERIKILPQPTPKFVLRDLPNDDTQVLTDYHIPAKYLLYPAQFWPHKNHAGLLQAVHVLKDQYNLAFPVVFVGSDQGNQTYIRQLVDKLDLAEQVHFLGFVPREVLISLYRQAFALTFLTFFGPDNLPPLEAFALGCPVVASNVPGAEEQLGDAALLVDPKDEHQIALAIKSLLDDPELRQTLIERGRKRASKWAGEDYVKGLFAILDDFATIRQCWG
jgi:glycosyltransferase involved in cell wall biosynthesis